MKFKVKELPLKLTEMPEEMVKFLNLDWEFVQKDVMTTHLNINEKCYSVDIIAKKVKRETKFYYRINI